MSTGTPAPKQTRAPLAAVTTPVPKVKVATAPAAPQPSLFARFAGALGFVEKYEPEIADVGEIATDLASGQLLLACQQIQKLVNDMTSMVAAATANVQAAAAAAPVPAGPVVAAVVGTSAPAAPA